MGGKQSQDTSKGPQIFSSMISHPKFSNAQIVQPSGQLPSYIEVNHSVGGHDIYKKWKQNIQSCYTDNQTSQALYMPTALQFEQKGICGKSGIIKAKYDYLPYILKDQIINRKVISQHFTDKQLCSAGTGLHSQGQIIGDVHPSNIFISEDGQIRICNLYTFLEQQTNYRKFLTQKQSTFIAPQQITQLQNGRTDSAVNLPKAECFSIGLTMLSALLLTDQSQLYKPTDYSFNQLQFNHEITTLYSNKQYHSLLLKIVANLCDYNPQNRLTCQQIMNTLKPFENQILQLDEFNIDKVRLSNQMQSKLRNQQFGEVSKTRGSYSKVVNLNSTKAQSNKTSSYGVRNPVQQRRQETTLPPLNNFNQNSNIQNSRELPSVKINNGQYLSGEQSSNQYYQIPRHGMMMSNSAQSNFSFMGNRVSKKQIYHNPSWQSNTGTFNVRSPSNMSFQNQINSSALAPPLENIKQINDNNNNNSNNKYQQQFLYEVPSQKPSQISSLYQYGQKIDSYIPPQPIQQFINPRSMVQNTESIYIPKSYNNIGSSQHTDYPSKNQMKYQQQPIQNYNKPSLASMGRQTHSIRPQDTYIYEQSAHRYTSSGSSGQQKYDQSGNLFKSYKDVLSNLDKQLEESRRLFPDR